MPASDCFGDPEPSGGPAGEAAGFTAHQEGEREEECSSAFNVDAAHTRLRWQAAQILRGLV